MESKAGRHLDRAIIAACLISLILIPATASAEDTYRFQRMWPTLHQPWYFSSPYGIAVDGNGNVYVADTDNRRIQKFTLDGQFITRWGEWGTAAGQFYEPRGVAVDNSGNVYVVDGYKRVQKFTSDGRFGTQWGSWGNGPGQFDEPHGIAVDGSGAVYVADSGNHRIQKFTPDGEFITKWGSEGSGAGEFSWPEGIAVNGNGQIYVADYDNHRIQKFGSNGEFIKSWGSAGGGDGQFQSPEGIALDRSGNVYVTDRGNYRVQKFTSEGEFVAKWGSRGSGDGQFAQPVGKAYGIAADRSGNIYVTDTQNDRIQKFSSAGQFVSKWASGGSGAGQFDEPHGVAIDRSGIVYVADKWNSRIQKFTATGEFIAEWGSEGSGAGQFARPNGIALDGEDKVYVADWSNHRIQKFTADGQFVTQWGSWGSGDGQFRYPEALAVDSSGNVYVVDRWNSRIQKFTAAGEFITKWGSEGSGDGQFLEPYGVAVDSLGDVYVADTENHRIQKFNSNGDFITKWGAQGSGAGEFNFPEGIALDAMGKVYVADKLNHRIQKFTAAGEFITSWGNMGSSPGLMDWPLDIAVAEDGTVYLSDRQNYRIQAFTRVALASKTKAIIVAGGGPYAGNNLWDATQTVANFAYRTLTYQGFTKETIYYLTSDTHLDLDQNGVLDDVDADATNADLQNAIINWASDADNLVLYLVDHGGIGTFRMSGTEILSASDLASWLDQLQQTIPGKVTVIYDACESGAFLSTLTPPSGKERIVITSTSPGESAYFISQGLISFSNYFWTHIFNGLAINDAFSLAKDAIGVTANYQHPLLDANSNGISNEPEDFALVQNTYIGNGTVIHGDAPVINTVSPAQTIGGTSSAILFASDVTDNDGIGRVWAVIRPPDYHQESSDNPTQELPSIDLMPAGENHYEAAFDGFNIAGTYQIAIYARDRAGNTAIPKITTVSAESPLRRRAIIVAGGSRTDEFWVAVEQSAKLCYEALSFQGYSDDDIYLLSPASIPGVSKLPVLSSLSNLDYSLTTWARDDTLDVVLYLIGPGKVNSFQINPAETLSASLLDTWLNSLQNSIPGKVTVIYDASRSGSFLPFLKPPIHKERILISSTGSDQSACVLLGGEISFSKYFWNRIANGTDVRDAFLHAKQAIEYTTTGLRNGPVVAQLDDTGNGLGNEKSDGIIARHYTIGVGIMLAGDDPLIGSIVPQQIVSEGGSGTLWVEDVTTTGIIAKVWAVITPPGFSAGTASDAITDLPVIDLGPQGGGRYEGLFSGLSAFGTYQVAIYAMDGKGNISLPMETTLCFSVCSDGYEEDNSHNKSTVIVINDGAPQSHNFHDTNDLDWVKFYGISGKTYTIQVNNAGDSCDSVIEVYDTNGVTRLALRDDTGIGEDEEIAWNCPQDGVYYVMIRQYDSSVYGDSTGYDLKAYTPIAPLAGFITGSITDVLTAQALDDVQLKTNSNYTALSLPDGSYLLVHPPGTFTVTAQRTGYIPATFSGVGISEGGSTPLDFVLIPLDTDSDGIPDAIENASFCLDSNDADTDDDGIADGDEDINQDGSVDPEETDPCDIDSDGDGIQDGTELGYTLIDVSPDTDTTIFQPDFDPFTITDPLDDDSDDDGWMDGEEDANHNGRVDPGETNPNQTVRKAMPWIPLLLLDD